MGIVVFPGTAFSAMLTPWSKSDFLHIIFILIILLYSPEEGCFQKNVHNFRGAFSYIDIYSLSAVAVVGAVDMWITLTNRVKSRKSEMEMCVYKC